MTIVMYQRSTSSWWSDLILSFTLTHLFSNFSTKRPSKIRLAIVIGNSHCCFDSGVSSWSLVKASISQIITAKINWFSHWKHGQYKRCLAVERLLIVMVGIAVVALGGAAGEPEVVGGLTVALLERAADIAQGRLQGHRSQCWGWCCCQASCWWFFPLIHWYSCCQVLLPPSLLVNVKARCTTGCFPQLATERMTLLNRYSRA